jgi:hypothetical protein
MDNVRGVARRRAGRSLQGITMGVRAAPAIEVTEAAPRWWERRWFLVLVILATMIPLLYPQIPPLVDLPGHVGRYRVELDLAHSPLLQRYYDYHWAPLGTLGVDLLVMLLGPVMGLEPAVKLIVMAIPPLTAWGFLWVAREVHGRVPPTALLALPFIYSFPFLFGFVNFALSVALAFLAFALWLRLGRLERTTLRTWLFGPISLAIYFCHTYGWGLLGLMCFSANAVRLREAGRSWRSAGVTSVVQVLPMALPLAVMWLTSPRGGGTLAEGWFDWGAKWAGLEGVLRDRWAAFDIAAVEVAAIMFLFALVSPKLRLARRLAAPALVLAAAFVLLPRFILDSAYADIRLLPYLIALAFLAIRSPADPRLAPLLAVSALLFFLLRLGGTTASLAMAADQQQAKLVALDFIPPGARVASFYGLPAVEPWSMARDNHLGGLVIARRHGFSNDQWITVGHNLLTLKYDEAGSFASNPSEVVRPNGVPGLGRTIDEALAQVPRDKFDYVWLLNNMRFDHRLVADLQPVWRGTGSVLYRIPHAAETKGRNGQLGARR